MPMRPHAPAALAALAILLLSACAASPRASAPAGGPPVSDAPVMLAEKETDAQGFDGGLWRAGPVLVSGQPSRKGLERAADEGVSTVINLRTPSEMDRNVKFDEARAARRLGMNYVQIPYGGRDHPASPETVDRFAAALENARGKVLLHCASGGRTSELWAAYLVRHRGFTPEEAVRHGRHLAMQPTGFEKMAELEATYEPKR